MGKGYSVFISDSEDPSIKIIELLDKSLGPVISNLSLEYDDSKVESIVPNPKKNPYILKNDITHFYFSFRGKLSEPFPIVIKYTDSYNQNYCEKITVDCNNALICPYISKMASAAKISALYSTYKYEEDQSDRIYYVKKLNKEEIEK